MLKSISKVFIYLVFLLYACVTMLSSCFGITPENDTIPISAVSDALNLDLSAGTVISNQDSHGGWLGDGETIVSIHFPKEDGQRLLVQIMKDPAWRPLPLTDNLSTIVYGRTAGNARWNPVFTDENGDPFLPPIKNGFFFFLDRHSQNTDSLDDSSLFSQGSFNFTLAIYDMDSHTLYYFELDT